MQKALRRHNTSVFEQFAYGVSIYNIVRAVLKQVAGDADGIGDDGISSLLIDGPPRLIFTEK
jgi:hypothetical protein